MTNNFSEKKEHTHTTELHRTDWVVNENDANDLFAWQGQTVCLD